MSESTSWHSPQSIYNLGHPAVSQVLQGPVVIEEKVDGSFFAFGVFGGELRCRSKGQNLVTDAPEKMFAPGVATAQALAPDLVDGWTYRGELLARPRHNGLTYSRVPAKNVILFDILADEEQYLSYDRKAEVARCLGLEVVPRLFEGTVTSVDGDILGLLERETCLGGPKIEGVVIKPVTAIFGKDKKALMAKFVSEAFREIQRGHWKLDNPSSGDIVESIIRGLKTEARWLKALSHLRDDGKITDSLKDIGPLMREVPSDIEKECREEILELLWGWAWPRIRRGTTAGLPEFYKRLLAQQQPVNEG